MYQPLCTLIVLIIVPATVLAHGPSRQKVTREITLNAPAVMVWDLISDFCSIAQWHPSVVACEGRGTNEPGAIRALTISGLDGPRIHEELPKFDANKMTYKDKITPTDNSVLAVSTYSSFLSVLDNNDGTSTVKWRAGFYRA